MKGFLTTLAILVALTPLAASSPAGTGSPQPACGSTVSGAAGKQCTYKVTCGQRYKNKLMTTSRPVGDLSACIRLAENYTTCLYADFEKATKNCRIWYGGGGTVETLSGFDLIQYTGPAPHCDPPAS